MPAFSHQIANVKAGDGMAIRTAGNTLVSIVDTGIDLNSESLRNHVIDSIAIHEEGTLQTDIDDKHGHGTLCSRLILKGNPNVQLHVIKLLNEDAMASSRNLLSALYDLQEIDSSIINLSVATTESKYAKELERACAALADQGKILVCSLANHSDYSYPAVFDSVIGVQAHIQGAQEGYWFNSSYKVQVIADGTPVMLPGLNNRYTMFGGNSKAAALFSGMLAKLLDDKPELSLSGLYAELEKRASRTSWEKQDMHLVPIQPISEEWDKYDYGRIQQMVQLVTENLKLIPAQQDKLLNTSLLHPQFGLTPEKCVPLIKEIERTFSVQFTLDAISLLDFHSIFSLLDLVEEDGECEIRI